MNNDEIQAYPTKGFEGIQAVQLAEIEKAKAEWAKKHDDLVASGADSAEVKASVDRAMKRLDRIEAEWSRPDAAQFHSKSIGEYLIESEAVKRGSAAPTGLAVAVGAKITGNPWNSLDLRRITPIRRRRSPVLLSEVRLLGFSLRIVSYPVSSALAFAASGFAT